MEVIKFDGRIYVPVLPGRIDTASAICQTKQGKLFFTDSKLNKICVDLDSPGLARVAARGGAFLIECEQREDAKEHLHALN